MPPATLTAQLATGVRLPYVEQGDPAGVPLILLHGYSDSHRSFGPLLAHLPHDLHAFAPTQRGHGDADRPPEGYGPGDMACDVLAFMDAVGVEAAVIAGHSGGSFAAQRFAVDHPGRTLGLVLVGGFHSVGAGPGVDELLAAVGALEDPVDPAFVREFQESTLTRAVPPEFFDMVVSESLKLPARVWKAYLDALIREGAPTDRGTITAPTLLIWGDHDAYGTHDDQRALMGAIPDARLIVHHGTGHVPHWEEPGRTAAEIGAFALSAGRTAAAVAA